MTFTTNPYITNPWVTNPWVTNPWITYCSPIDAKPTAGQTLTLNLSLPAGKSVGIDWGDGNTTEIVGPASSIDYANTYADAGTYPIRMSGDFQYLTRLEIEDVEVDGTAERLGALSGLTFFSCGGSNTLSGDIANLPTGLTYFGCYGSNTLSGDVANLPTGLTYFNCGGNNTISGDIANLPTGLTLFRCTGSNTISGDIANLPTGLTYFACYGSNTLSGDVANLPTGLTLFGCTGSNTISGDIANLPTGLTYFNCYGSNTISDYTTPHTWTTKPATFILVPVAPGGLSESEIDNLLIDFDADLTWSSGNVITLTGANAARSTASDAAVSNMVAEGCSITTN